MQHRIANSLQIIASIILMKARTVQSEETRLHLQDAHSRVMSIAAVQEHLHASGISGPVEITPYLSKLCETLATSMIGDNRPNDLINPSLRNSTADRAALFRLAMIRYLVMWDVES